MRNLDVLLKDATEAAKLAYQFAPGAYTFAVMASVMNAVEATRGISEFMEWSERGV
jgi:hypothetical protein